jgi:hypothetical protein
MGAKVFPAFEQRTRSEDEATKRMNSRNLSNEVGCTQNPALGTLLVWRFACGFEEAHPCQYNPGCLQLVQRRDRREARREAFRATGQVVRGIEIVEFACGIPNLLKTDFTDQIGGDIDNWNLRQPLVNALLTAAHCAEG